MEFSGTVYELVLSIGSGLQKSLNLWILLNADTLFANTPIRLIAAADRDDAYEPLEHILKVDRDGCTVNLKSAFLALPFHQTSFLPEANFEVTADESLMHRYEEESQQDTRDFCDVAIEKIMDTFIHASKRNLCDRLHVPLFDMDRNHTMHIKGRAYSLNILYKWRNECLQGFYEGGQFSGGVKSMMNWHLAGPRPKKGSTTRQKPKLDAHRPPKFKSTSLDYIRDDESWLSIALRGRRRLTLTVDDKDGQPNDLAPYWDKRAVSKKVLSTWVMIIVFAGVLTAGGGLFGGLALLLIFAAPYIDFYFKS